MTAASSKNKGRYAEHALVAWLSHRLPTGWHIIRARMTGSRDEGDVKILPPDGSPNRTIEVKYRTSSVGRAEISHYRNQAWVESMNYGSDRALLVVNRPRADVPRWLVHWSTDGELWLMAEVVMLPRLLVVDSMHLRRFSDALHEAAPITQAGEVLSPGDGIG